MCVRVLARVCATVCKVCTRVPNCAMHWRLYVCMPVYLFAHQSNTRHLCVYCSCHSSPARNTLRHLDTHTHTGWHLGWHLHWQHGARVWCPQKEAESCNPDPALGEFFGYVLCLCVCVRCQETQLSSLVGCATARFSPAFLVLWRNMPQ